LTTILIASLGGQPQVITLTADLLLHRGEHLDEVWVVFPGAHPRYQAAYKRLYEAFQSEPYRSAGMRLRAHSIPKPNGRGLADIRNAEDADHAWIVVSSLIGKAKRAGHRLHISLTGGRRALALMMFSAAMLYCTPGDRVWHIYTPPEVLDQVRDGARLHVPPEAGVRLIEIPFLPWGAWFPGVRELAGLTPREALAALRPWPNKATRERCELVWQRLTPRQREVLQALVAHPTREAAAEALDISVHTLDTHRETILNACRLVWPEEQVNLRFVREVFRGWLVEKGI